jgi:hypothetical protein
MRLFDEAAKIDWTFDEEADVLYLAFGAPRPAIGVDLGGGLVLRYDEEHRAVVGLTVIGLRDRLTRGLGVTDDARRA